MLIELAFLASNLSMQVVVRRLVECYAVLDAMDLDRLAAAMITAVAIATDPMHLRGLVGEFVLSFAAGHVSTPIWCG